jgi:hypothetical protein
MLTPAYKLRAKKLKELGYKNYKTYLESEFWLKRRADFEATHQRICLYCDQSAHDLHHRTYRNLGTEGDDDLEWLCREHHAEVQRYGVARTATEVQQRILLERGYGEQFVRSITVGSAFNLIGKLARGEVRSPREMLN